MSKPMSNDEFIRRAKAVHSVEYDYSVTHYVNMQTKVVIECPNHGFFEQLPQAHLRGQGCPVCGKEKCKETMMRKYGTDNPMKVKFIQNKARQTCLERYGTEWAMSNQIVKDKVVNTNQHRYGVDRPIQNVEIRNKMKSTVRDKYHVDNVYQVSEFKDKMHSTCLLRYGTEEPLSADVIREKIKMTNQQKYGGNAPLSSVEVRKKCEASVFKRYGVLHISEAAEIIEKVRATKSEKGTFSSSQSEEKLYFELCSVFGINNIKRHYGSIKYPFACDFYIVSKDMYIELNAHWTHGTHWFDKNSKIDQAVIQLWTQRNTKYYNNAVHVWTEADVRKRITAKHHNLNYVVFWDSKLVDARLWFSLNCPDGKDWDKEYSWL